MITGILMSLNDHGWGNDPNRGNRNESGRNNNSGPPDLDELWRDFNRRLSGAFGKKRGGPGNSGDGDNNGGGNGPNFPNVTPGQFGGGIGMLLGLALVVWFVSGFYIVDASQRGVVLTLGKYSETTDPGLRWRLPWPIQSHELVNLTGVRTVEIGYRGSEKNKVPKEALMLTDDENIVSVQFAVQYLLKDPKDYLFKNRHPDDAVTQAAETSIREVVGKNRMDFVLYEGRDVIAANTQKLMQDTLDRYDTGIQIRAVTMQSTQPPEQVQAAFDDAVKAGQDRERQKNEGEAYANDVIPRARGTASRLLQEAEGYRARLIATAEGEAARFSKLYNEYAKAPEVTRQRLYIETMQQVFANTSKVMIDAKSGGNLLYLPLDKLMQTTVPASVTPGGAVAPVDTGERPSAPASAMENRDVRTRGSLGSRDRGDR
jgi:membrane protease subunit HflK